jgi:hypothetical protein
MSLDNITSLGIAMVKNEADIIEAFVRHNLTFLDVLVVVDNDSADGTREILGALQAEGLPLIIFDDPIFGYFQSEILTFVYRRVVPVVRPRYVFLLDADEFIIASGREQLEAELAQLPPGSQAQYCWRTYVPAPEHGACSDPLRQITFRRRAEAPPYPKSIVVCSRDLDSRITIAQGSHDVQIDSLGSLPARLIASAALAHFPVRSLEQLQGKVLVGWLAYLAKHNIRKVAGEGFQWQALYEKCTSAAGLNLEDVTREALTYAQPGNPQRSWPADVVEDPVAAQYGELTYRALGSVSALAKLARSCERLFVPNGRYVFAPSHADSSGTAQSTSTAASSPTAFQASWHNQNLYLDLPPFRHIGERYRPDSVLDLGCGLGGYLRFFETLGARRTVGVDGFAADSHSLIGSHYLHRDLGRPLELDERFSLLICTEVVEHLAAAAEEFVLDNIVNHARERIIFSGADVGQPGLGHVNCRPIAYWLERFWARGWMPDLLDTYAMRSLATFSWFQRNLVVFTPRIGDRVSLLKEVADLNVAPIRWTDIKAAVITHSFTPLLAPS